MIYCIDLVVTLASMFACSIGKYRKTTALQGFIAQRMKPKCLMVRLGFHLPRQARDGSPFDCLRGTWIFQQHCRRGTFRATRSTPLDIPEDMPGDRIGNSQCVPTKTSCSHSVVYAGLFQKQGGETQHRSKRGHGCFGQVKSPTFSTGV
jgi:hypothetical protein